MKKGRVITALSIGLIVLVVYLLASTVSQKPVEDPLERPSTYFTDETGARASLLLLEKTLGSASVYQLKEPLWTIDFPAYGGPSTIIVAAPTVPLQALEAEEIENWVHGGGQLILFLEKEWEVEDTVPLLARFGVTVSPQGGNPRTLELDSSPHSLRVENTTTFTGEFEPFLTSGKETLAISKPTGDGRVIVFADTSVITNESLGQADNAIWLVRLVEEWGEGTVAFDEFHHGFGARTGFFGLLKSFLFSPWGLPFLYLGVLGLIYLVVLRRRLGKPVHLEQDVRRDPKLLIRARAGLLRTATNYHLAVDRLCGELAHQLRDMSGRPANLEKLAEKQPKVAAIMELRRLAWEGKMKEKQMLEVARLCHEVREEGHFGE
ncbi:MAG: hypothetical protein KC800_03910 [Candidatus Eremiobacteraeota bacterium]|nr:hypothetical protein [Candidatus Eremiobacteraeota bacterium]